MTDVQQRCPVRDARAQSWAPDGSADLAAARVVLVSHGFQPNYERGFTNGLADAGAQITLVSSDRTDTSALRPNVQVVNLRGSQDANRSGWSKAFNLVWYHVRLMWLALRCKGAVVHVFGLLVPVFWCGLVEGLWFRLVSGRYVLTVHNLLPHDRHTRLNRWLHALAYRLPSVLVVHVPAMKQQLVNDFRISERRIVVMEHGIEPFEELTPSLPAIRTEGPIRLLFFGALLRYKGLDLLLDALAGDVPDFKLKVAGPCVDNQLVSELQAAIAIHPRRDAIEWTRGYVPEHDVAGLFLQADVLMLPYRHIDQSGVLFQALRFGLPVVATDVGSFRTYVTAEIGLVCTANDVAALSEALRRFYERRALFLRERIKLHSHVYEWPRVVRQLDIAYCSELN